MKIDRLILSLFVFPFISVLLCIAVYILIPEETIYHPAKPDFLRYADQLSLYSENIELVSGDNRIRDIFHREAIDQATPEVSMIVTNGPHSYSIIDNKKMKIGDKTDLFTLLSIDKNSVEVAYNNGTKERVHVKTY